MGESSVNKGFQKETDLLIQLKILKVASACKVVTGALLTGALVVYGHILQVYRCWDIFVAVLCYNN